MTKRRQSRGDGEETKYGPERRDRIWPGLIELDRIASQYWRGQVELAGVRMKLPDRDDAETLIVLTGFDEEGTPVVGFHAAVGPLEALAGALRRMVSGTMKWKVDEYRAEASNRSVE